MEKEVCDLGEIMKIEGKSVVILGGGISGLCVAHRLKQLGVPFVLLESRGRVGGKIQTAKVGASQVEQGPNSLMLRDGAVKELIEDLGLSQRVTYPEEKRPARYICDGEKIHHISPFSIVPYIGIGSFLKILTGGYSRPAAPMESVHDFFVRKLGKPVAEKLVAPFVSGIYAGDAHKLIASQAFPKIWEMDQKYNSFWGGLAGRKKGAKKSELRSGITTFPEGLEELTQALYEELKESIQLDVEVLNLKYTEHGWSIRTQNSEQMYSQVISTLPSHNLANLLTQREFESLVKHLRDIRYPWVRVMHVAYPQQDVRDIARGYGFLNIPDKSLPFLGCLFSSQLFSHRSSRALPYFTFFIGGETQGHLRVTDAKDSLPQIHESLQKVLKFRSDSPRLLSFKDWPDAIPQYDIHQYRLSQYLQGAQLPKMGLHLGSNFVGGISIPECVESSFELAKIVADHHRK